MSLAKEILDEIRDCRSKNRYVDFTAGDLFPVVDYVDYLHEIFFQIFKECGEDTDGAEKYEHMGNVRPGIEVQAFRAVKQLREDYNECLNTR